MVWYGGIDVGSVSTKIVFGKRGRPSFFFKIASGSNFQKAADTALYEILKLANLDRTDIVSIYATGCGSDRVRFADAKASDLTCSAMGVHQLFPHAKTLIEIGGQSSKVIRINDEGKIINFLVSEKCASGSGRFLQVIARVLQVSMDEIGTLSLKSKNPISFSTSCAVFGESEAVSRIAEGTLKEDIIAGVHQALATKISTLAERINMEPPCALIGGGALDIGLVKRIEMTMGVELEIPEEPQVVTALGAAMQAENNKGGRTPQ
jgi:(R)-2-hydroxyacyl-CoA dehydratese activating ATPase